MGFCGCFLFGALFIIHYSLFIIHYSLFIIHYSLFIITYYLLFLLCLLAFLLVLRSHCVWNRNGVLLCSGCLLVALASMKFRWLLLGICSFYGWSLLLIEHTVLLLYLHLWMFHFLVAVLIGCILCCLLDK